MNNRTHSPESGRPWTVRTSTPGDLPDWLELAREVEQLFGPMVDDPDFIAGLEKGVLDGSALCAAGEPDCEDKARILGGIIVSREENEIAWFSVLQESRGRGIGAALLAEALMLLDRARPVSVTTFDDTVEAGIPARRLYQSFGFRDASPAGMNPAGIPIVTMILHP